MSKDPIKIIVYALGFSVGNYVGSLFEEKLGFGTVRIEAIVNEEDGINLVKTLRERNFAVTVVEGEGMKFKKQVIIMHIQRKGTEEVTKLINNLKGNAFITINEVKPVYGGYGLVRR